MKKNLLFLLALCVASALFISCKKDDDSEVVKPTINTSLLPGKWIPIEDIVEFNGVKAAYPYETTEGCPNDYLEFKNGNAIGYSYSPNFDFDSVDCLEEVETSSYTVQGNKLITTEGTQKDTLTIFYLDNNYLEIELYNQDNYEYFEDEEPFAPTDKYSERLKLKRA